ncbi:MAG: Mur ligase family protein, partial [Clostridia bacterium]|nr:Mur ligase family protein [Clostridia bacterium]
MTIYYLLFAASAAISYIFFGRKFFAVFQQCGYKPKCFFAALSNECKTETECLSTYSLTFFMYLLVFSVAFPLSQTLYIIVLFLASLLFSLAVFLKSRPVKSVKLTRRFVRMAIASCVLVVFAAVGSLKVALLIFGLKLPVCLVIPGVLFLITLSEPVVICLGYYVLLPYDFIAFKLSIRKCKKKLEKYPELIRIGITGSYGKTTVKNILAEMLSAKYKVVKTPLSYNTPLGICIAAKNITRETEIFIAEMGARKRGDIKELCDIVKPDVGVITGICGQHLETFKTLENVKKAKNELIEALPPDGYAFFSSDGEGSRELYEKSAKRKIIAGRKEGFVHGVSYSDDADGAIIELSLDKATYETRTFLRGEHNLGNICLAAAVALKLGVPPEKIILAITRLKP